MKGASAASSPEPAALALLAAANVTLLRLPRAMFVPASVATAATVTGLARRSGATWTDLRMDARAARRGVAWGVGVGTLAAASVATVVTTPRARSIVVDEQALNARGGDLAYHLLLRIPIGTALSEEVAFRAALPAILATRRSRRAADATSAVLFGLWHVVDALRQIRTHPERRRVASAASRAAVVGATVLATAAVGLAFAVLRDRAGSVAAPVLVHAAVNSTGFVGGVIAARRA